MRPRLAELCWGILLATSIHLDWHLARSGSHGSLSGHFAQHWVFALPIFALLAVGIWRRPQGEQWQAAAWIIGIGVLIGQVLEPLYEMLESGLSWRWLVQALRWTAFAEFLAAGLGTLVLLLAWRERTRPTDRATWHGSGD